MSADAKRPAPVPKVSVVTPTYNYGRFLRESIQSVLDQTFRDWELIVVDDGSTDDSAEVVASLRTRASSTCIRKTKGYRRR